MNNSEQPDIPSQDKDCIMQSRIEPSPLNLGVTYEGAVLEGSLHISPAREVYKIHIDRPQGQEMLQLCPYAKTSPCGLIWTFRARTDFPTAFLAFVGFWTDFGKTSTHFSLEVRAGSAPGGRVLFCESPFDASSSQWTHANLNLLTRELELQTNSVASLPSDLSPFQVVLLHGYGLRSLVEGGAKVLHRYLETGGRVIVLADYSYRDSVMLANHLTEPYGIRIEDREYQEVLCNRMHIEDHKATDGIKRLRWFRPSPIIARPPARLLVRNPECSQEGFLACSGFHDNLFVIGTAWLRSLVREGWPFDNGQLLANLLTNK
jgi:hypothetical protein